MSTLPNPPAPTSARQRPKQPARPSTDLAVESLRGLALVLLVLYHAADEVPPPHIDGSSAHYPWYEYISATLRFIRMPLFTVISGYVYAIRPVTTETLQRFVRGKLRRLVLPFFVAVTLTLGLFHWFIPEHGMSYPLSRLHHAYIYAYGHFWFLQAIAGVFSVVALLELGGALRSVRGWLFSLAGCLALPHLGTTELFSYDGFTYLLPYFMLGLGFRRFPDSLSTGPMRWAAGLTALVGFTLQQLTLTGVLALDLERQGLLATVAGFAACHLLLSFRHMVPWLAVLGGYSFSVYLYHHFGILLGKGVHQALGLSSLELMVLLKFTLGLSIGITMELLLRRSPLLSPMFLGVRALGARNQRPAQARPHPSGVAQAPHPSAQGAASAEPQAAEESPAYRRTGRRAAGR